ncbi:hypothetical protein BKI52_43265 [marine bacterium AO1-C]|nr:hypothetical protein BKI52_43265 [marine bacterium AO1-C]
MNTMLIQYRKFLYRCWHLLALISGPVLMLQAQDRLDVVPPAPEPAALGKYVDIPVSQSSGSAQISIPLTAIRGRELSVPVSLSYHASGIRVGDVASWTGLGWSLQAHGVVNRQIRGLPDDHSNNGWFAPSPWDQTKTIGEFARDYEYVPMAGDNAIARNLASGDYDSEPDLFSIQFPGGGAQFVLDYNKKPRFISHQDGKVELQENAQGQFTGFIYTTPQGIRYTFDQAVVTQAPRKQLSNLTMYQYNSSWYLSKIENANRTDAILFTYVDMQTEQRMYNTQTSYWEKNLGIDINSIQTSTSQITYNAKRLVSIQSVKEEVRFITASQERQDLAGDYALSAIEHYNRQSNQLLYAWSLTHTYEGTGNEENKRMYLTSVQQKGLNNTSIPPYTFEYHPFPNNYSRVMGGRDWWGFCNGVPSTGLPKMTLLVPDPADPNKFISKKVGNASFEVDPAWVKAGSLRKITYPTGGYRVLEYESNQYEQKQSFVEGTGQLAYATPVTLQQQYQKKFGNYQIKLHSTVLSIHRDEAATSGVWEKETTFRVVSPQGVSIPVKLDAQLTGDLGLNGSQTSVVVSGTGTIGQIRKFTLQDHGTAWVNLPSGLYTVKVTIDQNDTSPLVEAIATIEVPVPTTDKKIGGGIRIFQIREYATANALPKVMNYQYQEKANPHISSGTLLNQPVHAYVQASGGLAPFCQAGAGDIPTNSECYRQVVLNNQSAFSGVPPAIVYYQAVKVSEGFKGENGYTWYTYLPYAPQAQPEAKGGSPLYFPFPKVGNASWQSGLLLRKEVYNADNQLVLKSQNEYEKVYQEAPVGYKMAYRSYPLSTQGGHVVGNNQLFFKYGNEDFIGYARLKKTTTQQYDDKAVAYLENTQQFFYDNADYPTLQNRTIKTDSKGDIYEQQTLFAQDLPNSSVYALMKVQLLDKHMLHIPIEQRTFLQRGQSKWLIAGQKTQFAMYHTNLLLPHSEWKVETSSPITATSFLANPDLYYQKKMTFLEYTPQERLGSYFLEDQSPVSLLWGQEGIYLQAKADNAASNTIYYQGFEESQGNTGDAKTGSQAFSGSFTTTVPLPANKYQLSYWQKNGGQWTLQKQSFTHSGGNYNLDLSGHIDEVRIHPAAAQMSTYSYLPDGRLHSTNDLNSRSQYYQYDDLGRLQYLKDYQGNYLKHWDYQYLKD